MNKILLALIGAVLCAAIASAGILTVKNRAKESVASKTGVTQSSAPERNPTQASQSQTASANTKEAPDPAIPDHVVYWQLFHHNTVLMKKAEEAERQGKDAAFLRNFYKHEAKLNDNQAEILREISTSCELEVNALDQEAKVIIQNYRAAHPGGRLQPGEKLPPPPPQLQTLQQRRNNKILQARDRLSQAFGQAAFADFQKFVNEKVKPKIKPQSMDTLRPAGPEGQQREPRSNPFKDKKDNK
jgi:hypothetical protein